MGKNKDSMLGFATFKEDLTYRQNDNVVKISAGKEYSDPGVISGDRWFYAYPSSLHVLLGSGSIRNRYFLVELNGYVEEVQNTHLIRGSHMKVIKELDIPQLVAARWEQVNESIRANNKHDTSGASGIFCNGRACNPVEYITDGPEYGEIATIGTFNKGLKICRGDVELLIHESCQYSDMYITSHSNVLVMSGRRHMATIISDNSTIICDAKESYIGSMSPCRAYITGKDNMISIYRGSGSMVYLGDGNLCQLYGNNNYVFPGHDSKIRYHVYNRSGVPVSVKEVISGKHICANTWYRICDGDIIEEPPY